MKTFGRFRFALMLDNCSDWMVRLNSTALTVRMPNRGFAIYF